MRILLVEDTPDNAEIISRILDMEGHCVAIASTAKEAIEMFTPYQFDVVLLDLSLPDMSGEELATHIQGRPIIIMSAVDRKRIDRASAMVKPASTLRKPFSSHELFDALASLP